MSLQTLRRVFGVFLMIVSMAVLAWSLWPLPVETRQVSLDAAALRMEDPRAAAAAGRLGGQQVKTTWPAAVRVGEPAEVRLEITSSDAAAWPASGGGDAVLLAEARLEMAGVKYQPVGEVSEAWIKAQAARFVWSLRADRAGEFPGTIWLHVQAVSPTGTLLARKVLLAQRIQVQARDLFGLSGPSARWLGLFGVLIGAALALDGVVMRLVERRAAPGAPEN